MKLFRKAFLLIVGAVAIAAEEATKSMEEANRSIEERRAKLLKTTKQNGSLVKAEAEAKA